MLGTRIVTVTVAVVALLLGSNPLGPQDAQADPAEHPDPVAPRVHDRFNPPYPRIGVYSWQNSGWPTVSFGSRLEKLEHHDQVWLEGGLDDDGEMKSDELKQMNNSQFYIAMTKTGSGSTIHHSLSPIGPIAEPPLRRSIRGIGPFRSIPPWIFNPGAAQLRGRW